MGWGAGMWSPWDAVICYLLRISCTRLGGLGGGCLEAGEGGPLGLVVARPGERFGFGFG